jgi:hypothetical protein
MRRPKPKNHDQREELIQEAIKWASNPGEGFKDEWKLAHIEALLRDALGQKHGVWKWRVGIPDGRKYKDGDAIAGHRWHPDEARDIDMELLAFEIAGITPRDACSERPKSAPKNARPKLQRIRYK